MRELFPREIRDIVYGYILEQPTVTAPKTIVDPKTSKLSGNYFHHAPGSKHDLLGNQHVWNENFVGLHLKMELVEAWYRETNFVLTLPSTSVLMLFTRDRWDVDVVPFEHLKNVTMIMHTDISERWLESDVKYLVSSLLKCKKKVSMTFIMEKPNWSEIYYTWLDFRVNDDTSSRDYIIKVQKLLFAFMYKLRSLEIAGHSVDVKFWKGFTMGDLHIPASKFLEKIEKLSEEAFNNKSAENDESNSSL
ncbi:uncharacterized protein K460DRAFT_400333 [Cucurbitaria berberidis CBS 394.84]|uniref:Uncharacterized protein n=1 Tax=Cucurbitaria berberidis CBS 394.84 TaxID=1168544 RepID=A0A9P4GRU5_9PLEO|nr:uncharacterized protein K460DRAFT_400333 [Cucurbitaria berberidis CBS 394.84]KAF1850261.1 hypothetical protein K460DRAFT_400333 [Cucurbitaria berberidis CBS 394.84]